MSYRADKLVTDTQTDAHTDKRRQRPYPEDTLASGKNLPRTISNYLGLYHIYLSVK